MVRSAKNKHFWQSSLAHKVLQHLADQLELGKGVLLHGKTL